MPASCSTLDAQRQLVVRIRDTRLDTTIAQHNVDLMPRARCCFAISISVSKCGVHKGATLKIVTFDTDTPFDRCYE